MLSTYGCPIPWVSKQLLYMVSFCFHVLSNTYSLPAVFHRRASQRSTLNLRSSCFFTNGCDQLAGLYSNVLANGRHNVQCSSLLLWASSWRMGTSSSWPSRTSRSSRSSRTFVTAFTNARAMDNSMVRTNIRLTNRARKRSWSYHFGKRPFVLTVSIS